MTKHKRGSPLTRHSNTFVGLQNDSGIGHICHSTWQSFTLFNYASKKKNSVFALISLIQLSGCLSPALVTLNEPYRPFYADGIYNRQGHRQTFETKPIPIEHGNFTFYFEFYTKSDRNQWPIVFGRSGRYLGVMLDQNGQTFITVNNQKEKYKLQGQYVLNKWNSVRIEKNKNHSMVYLNDELVGDFTFDFNMNVYRTGTVKLTSANYSNGKAFEGGLRNIILINSTNTGKVDRLISKNLGTDIPDSILFHVAEGFNNIQPFYYINGLNWNSFRMDFDYCALKESSSPFVIGKEWRLIKFYNQNGFAKISLNNERQSFLTNYEMKDNESYEVSIRKRNKNIYVIINNELVTEAELDDASSDILDSENEITCSHKPIYDQEIVDKSIKNITVYSSSTTLPKETSRYKTKIIIREIKDDSEGLLFLDFLETESKGDHYLQGIPKFDWQSFSCSFEFLPYRQEDQFVLEMGTYSKNSKIGLWLTENGNVALTMNQLKDTIKISEPFKMAEWNSVFLKYDQSKIEFYLNEGLVYEGKCDLSSNRKYAVVNNRNSLSKRQFKGKLRDIRVYKKPLGPF